MKKVLVSESLLTQAQQHLERQAEGKQLWSTADSRFLAEQLRAVIYGTCVVKNSIVGTTFDRIIVDEIYQTPEVTTNNLVIGGKYNWISQPDRLIYIGKSGGWYQFRKIGDPRPVWCEVRADSLSSFEVTKENT